MAHYSSLRELYLTRVREFYRQPARLFWVYGFPTVLAIFLGVAFRGRPPAAITAAAATGAPGSQKGGDTLPGSRPAAGRTAVVPNPVTSRQAMERLGTGEAALVVE